MGFCKCPKRQVTQQFCFEHKVNVCEFCMLSAHSRCYVQAYLQWLENSSYQAVCALCHQNLANDHCLRLLCFHIFHWNCLNSFAESLSSANSNNGAFSVNCPTCNVPLAPPTDITSPLAEEIRRQLSTAQWCRANLSRPSPLSISNNIGHHLITRNDIQENGPKSLPPVTEPVAQPPPVVIPFNHDTNSIDCDYTNSVTNARKLYNSNQVYYDSHTKICDVDEDKYRRRSLMENIYKWLRSYKLTKHGNGLSLRGTIILVIIAFFTVSILLHYFLKMGRESAELDPLLDPRSNPNIKVSDE